MEDHSSAPVPTDDDINSFIIAIKSGFIEQIIGILNTFGKDIVNRVEPQTRQPSLYFAAILIDEKTSFQIMKLLIENGANALFKDQIQQTVMFYVCREGKQSCIDLLLSRNVPIDDEDIYGQTPLYYAASQNRIEILNKFTNKENFNHKDKLAGQTPLFYAARKGHLQMCKWLIEYGSDPLFVDNHNKTAAQYARKAKFIQVADFLTGEIKRLKEASKMSVSEPINESSHNQNKKNAKKQAPQLPKQSYKIVFMDEKGQLHDLSQQQVRQMLKDKPQLQNMLANPESIPSQLLEGNKGETWDKISMKILNLCWKLKGAFWFHEPVDPIKFNIMDYFDIITRPMDLGRIKKKLIHNVYNNANQFVQDFRLVFNNSYRYNGQAHDISKCAKQLQNTFEQAIKTHNLQKFLS